MNRTTDKRAAGLSLINFLVQANMAIFVLGALLIAAISWILGDYLILTASLLTIVSTMGLMIIAVSRYGNRRFSLLAHFPEFMLISLFMFKTAAVKPEKGLEWEKTNTESRSTPEPLRGQS